MEYLIKDEKLEIIYQPGKGAWTYHLQIPNTKHLKAKWGNLKVSGLIDDYKVESKNLFPIKGQDKLISINNSIRKSINKSGGDLVTATFFLLTTREQVNEKSILETFEESGVLQQFQNLSNVEKDEIIYTILAQKTEEKQIKAIIQNIENLTK